jgi:hypothetical protein
MKVQALCDRLVANDAALTELKIRLEDVDDAELKLILDAAKINKTVKKVFVGSRGRSTLSVPAALSLAFVVSEHPEIQEIVFDNVKFIAEFGPIALAIQQNRNLTRLKLDACRGTPNIVECIRWLLTENALQSMTLVSINDGDPSFDISGALLGNSSLKELVLNSDRGVIRSEIFQAIPHMIRTNQDFETINLILSDTITERFELVRLVAQAAEGHASLNKLAITYPGHSGNSLYADPSADLINHFGTAKAIGTMLHNAPALRELSLVGCYMGSAGTRHLANGLSSKNSVVEKVDFFGISSATGRLVSFHVCF